jgi:hypoxanthine phosphoribosyltransferase
MSAQTSLRRLAAARELRETVARIGSEIAKDHPGGALLIGVLTGCVVFLADLVRSLAVPCRVDFIGVSSYAWPPSSAEQGHVRLTKDLDLDIAGEEVVLVEDIVDTGLRCSYVLGELRARLPRSLELCTLLDRRSSRIAPVEVRYRGLEVGEEYVIGYGMDFEGRYRNLPELFVADPLALSDRDARLQQVFAE